MEKWAGCELIIAESYPQVINPRDNLVNMIFQRQDGVYDKEGLDVSGELLAANPDFYTLWNFRREVFLHLKEEQWVFWKVYYIKNSLTPLEVLL